MNKQTAIPESAAYIFDFMSSFKNLPNKVFETISDSFYGYATGIFQLV